MENKPESDVNSESSWDDLYNDDGDCVEPQLAELLADKLCFKGEEQANRAKNDHPSSESESDIDEDTRFSHVLEVYDFQSSLHFIRACYKSSSNDCCSFRSFFKRLKRVCEKIGREGFIN